MTATFGTDLVDKTKQAKVDACRVRLQSAARAAKQLEADVRWLVKARAWDVLGYKDFSEMWEKENGFVPPTHVQALAVDAFQAEGMNTRRGKAAENGVNGHTLKAIADAVGVSTNNPTSTVHGMLTQLRHGVPPENVVKGADKKSYGKAIAEHGTRPYQPGYARPRPRRLGKAPDELVAEGFTIPRQEADEIAEIARQADVPKAEIYRQAVAEYLMRHRESRPDVAS